MMERNQRRARPSIEGLEGRALLSASRVAGATATANSGVADTTAGPATVTRQTTTEFAYTTADGAKVVITLGGPGNLTGTNVDSNGNLNLVFAATSIFTQINGTVTGGSGQAALGTIRDANVVLNSLTGVGGELMGRIHLPQFNLVSGGNINLVAGVNELYLNSVAANSQLHLRDTPLNTTLGISTTVDPLTGAGLGYAGNQPYHSSTTGSAASGSRTNSPSGISTAIVTTTTNTSLTTNGGSVLDPTEIGFAGGNVGAINGAIPIINTIGNGQNFRGTPGLSQSTVSFGRSLSYGFETANPNAIQLLSVGGAFVPGSNLIEPRDQSQAGYNHIPPPGVILSINHVLGSPSNINMPLGDAQIYGFDPSTSTLIRFDAATGAVEARISIPSNPNGNAYGGVALARNGTEQVVLVGAGTTVQAYDAASGVFVGQFTTRQAVGGIATTSAGTILLNPTAGNFGVAQTINVAASLTAGTTVDIGQPFAPTREFTLGGGVTGVAGRDQIYAIGSGFFDTEQPNLMQAGIIALNVSTSGTLSESSRTAFTSSGIDVPAANGSIANDASRALGSIGSNLAVDAGVTNGQNSIVLVNPLTLAVQGSVQFAYPNALSDLSESFHPELAGTALIDVQGNVQSFTTQTANGLVFNDSGNFNKLQAKTVSNSSIVGLPFSHVNIQNRTNTTIVTNSRLVGTRGGVIVNPNTRQVGPLVLPNGTS